MTKTKYDKKLLEEICNRDKCIIDFEKIGKYNRDIDIEFTCKCGNNYKKTFRLLYQYTGAYCNICTNNIKQYKLKKTNLDKYGVEHISQSQEIKDKHKKNNLDKYGVEYTFQVKEFQNKSKLTILNKYGVEHTFQVKEFKEKYKQTCLDKYGVEHISQSQEITDKIKQTNLDKYGVEHTFQVKEFQNKSKLTNIHKYGVEYPAQNAEISEKQSKNSYKLKSFIFPCGNIVVVQGYEHFLLEILIKEGYTYDDIITNRSLVPVIWYAKNDKKHRYYCDVFIPNTNCIYEVKSTWTYEKDIEVIPLKKQACIDNGYNFKLYIFNYKGCIIESL